MAFYQEHLILKPLRGYFRPINLLYCNMQGTHESPRALKFKSKSNATLPIAPHTLCESPEIWTEIGLQFFDMWYLMSVQVMVHLHIFPIFSFLAKMKISEKYGRTLSRIFLGVWIQVTISHDLKALWTEASKIFKKLNSGTWEGLTFKGITFWSLFSPTSLFYC